MGSVWELVFRIKMLCVAEPLPRVIRDPGGIVPGLPHHGTQEASVRKSSVFGIRHLWVEEGGRVSKCYVTPFPQNHPTRSTGMSTAGVCVRMWMGTLEWPGIRYKMKATSCDNYTGIVSSLTSSFQKHGTREHFPCLLIPLLY